MTNSYDTIQELRAELASVLDPEERRQIRKELTEAIERQARLDAEFDALVPPD